MGLLTMNMAGRAGDKIKYYFNHQVDTTVSEGTKAIFLNQCLADTLVAYINRSKYTLDIAQYDYNQSNSYANVANAVNAAYTRGVKVRWIYDGSSSNTGLTSLNAGIYTLGSPTSGSYGIMHNKFVLIDAYSTNPDDAYVWTGSPDWSLSQFNSDYNNVIIFQDSALAHAYTAEFNMMWGDTGVAPNLTLSKFGPHKTDLGQHNFSIDGKHVELYFSPSDGTNSHIQSTIQTANRDLYVAMYAFTDNSDAQLMVNRHNAGVYVAAIEDNFSQSYSPATTLTAGIGSGNFLIYSGAGIYHNKFMIVDANDSCSDPMVLTGSHNWSLSADTKNDENTVIVHDKAAANVYYQSFKKDFNTFGGTLTQVIDTPCNGFPVNSVTNVVANTITIAPNPSTQDFTINGTIHEMTNVNIVVVNEVGQVVYRYDNMHEAAGEMKKVFSPVAKGMYLMNVQIGNKRQALKLMKL